MNLWALAELPESSEYNCFLFLDTCCLTLAKGTMFLKAYSEMTNYAIFELPLYIQ